jgi:hypothetical protein
LGWLRDFARSDSTSPLAAGRSTRTRVSRAIAAFAGGRKHIGADDFVRFTTTGEFIAGSGAPALASDRVGFTFRVVGDSEVILVVDERLWIIAYRIGQQPHF